MGAVVTEQKPHPGTGPARIDALASRRASNMTRAYWLDKARTTEDTPTTEDPRPAPGGDNGDRDTGALPAADQPTATASVLSPGGGLVVDRQVRAQVIEAAHVLPDVGVFSWMDADAVQVASAFARTARFVEWLSAVFEVREIPKCWPEHPPIVVELWALERFHRQVFVTGEDLSGPVTWLNQLAVVRARLREEYKASGCQTESGHQDPVGKNPSTVTARRDRYTRVHGGNAAVVTWWGWPDLDDAGQPVTTPDHPIPDPLANHYAGYTLPAAATEPDPTREGPVASGDLAAGGEVAGVASTRRDNDDE